MHVQAREEKERKRREAAASERLRREAASAAEQRTIDQIKLASRAWLERLFPAGMSIRQGLKSLNVAVGVGAEGERVALRRARAFYHPDAAKRRQATLEEVVKCEEIFKALASLR